MFTLCNCCVGNGSCFIFFKRKLQIFGCEFLYHVFFLGATSRSFDMARQVNVEVWMPSNIIAFAIKGSCVISQTHRQMSFYFSGKRTLLPEHRHTISSIYLNSPEWFQPRMNWNKNVSLWNWYNFFQLCPSNENLKSKCRLKSIAKSIESVSYETISL